MLQSAFIASQKGKLYSYNPTNDSLSLAFNADDKAETLMGLEKKDGFLYVAGSNKIFKLKIDDKLTLIKIFMSQEKYILHFHQMMIINNYLHVAVTYYNQIWIFDLDLNLYKKIKIDPPIRRSPVGYKTNYNHLNSIFYQNGNFYVCLNWLTQKQYGPSGVAVLNDEMKEIDYFEYGWELHNYMILENRKYALCSSSGKIKGINHPHKAGLMVDGTLVFEYNPDLFFCKDFSIDKNFIYIVGGGVAKKEHRNADVLVGGIIFILDRKFNHISTHKFDNVGQFLGCLLFHEDFTKGLMENDL